MTKRKTNEQKRDEAFFNAKFEEAKQADNLDIFYRNLRNELKNSTDPVYSKPERRDFVKRLKAKMRGKGQTVLPAIISELKSIITKPGGKAYTLEDIGDMKLASLAEPTPIAEENPDYFMPYQYGNEANPRAHYETTGPEIIEQLPDIDVFVAGLGTGGTLMGVGKALKEYNKNIKVVAAAPHPEEVVPALRSIEHGFIPPILDLEKLDSRILVGEEESFYWTKMLMESCGIFAGVSCGAVTAAALKVAKKIKTGNIVIIIADSGERYLSSKLWEMDYKDIKEIGEQKIWW